MSLDIAAIVDWFSYTRQVGRTEALIRHARDLAFKTGIKTYIICADQQQAVRLVRKEIDHRVHYTSLANIESLRGMVTHILVDHFAYEEVIRGLLRQRSQLMHELGELKNMLKDMEGLKAENQALKNASKGTQND